MNSIELYINNQLCDIENPADFSVYLKRQLLSPGELSKKDAQKSYDITLPATTTNNAIFGYTNIEEIKGKFASLYDATLIVNGIKIFDGKFRLSEVTNTSYKGNLGVPAKEIKDIFGDKMMNEMGEWLIDFAPTGANAFNHFNDPLQDNPILFFPYVLYGLLPKTKDNTGHYSAKHILDSQVIHSPKDFKPSFNCLQTMQKIFKNSNCELSGTAFDDEALKHLFMSYHNDKDKESEWLHENDKLISLTVNSEISWFKDRQNEKFYITKSEPHTLRKHGLVYTKDSTNITCHNSNTQKQLEKTDGNYALIKVPQTGVYRISLEMNYNMDLYYDEGAGNDFQNEEEKEKFIWGQYWRSSPMEIQLRRSFNNTVVVKKDTIDFVNSFYRNNIEQTNSTPKSQQRFPRRISTNLNRVETNRIDLHQDPYFLAGFSFNDDGHPYYKDNFDQRKISSNAMINNGAKSWNKMTNYTRTYVACPLKGYVDGYFNSTTDNDKHKISNCPSSYTTAEKRSASGNIYFYAVLNEGEDIYLHIMTQRSAPTYDDLNITLNMEIIEKEYWLTSKLDDKGILNTDIEWNTKPNKEFSTKSLDLSKYLSSKIKIETWINDFCKAFNLTLEQVADKKYELNTKKPEQINSNRIIDLDSKVNTNIARNNSSLGLPSTYEIKYKIKEDEEGYFKTKDTGSESKIIDATSNKAFYQSINFSYNWKKDFLSYGQKYKFPIITDKKIWEDPETKDDQTSEEKANIFDENYERMMNEKYYDYTQRLWFKDNSTKLLSLYSGPIGYIKAAFVTDTYDKDGQRLVLNYKDESNSILNTYFTLLTDADNCYTTVECYLTPEEYSQIDSSMAKLNGDLYYIAEVDGYDPMCKRKATLKLVRKIQK